MRRALLGMLAGAALVVTPVRTAAASGCPALDYQADVARAAAALATTPADVSAARLAVASALAIGGSAALGPVRDDLAADAPALDDAAQRLGALSAALAYPPGATCNEDSSAALGQLHDVYAGPDFRQLDAGGGGNLLQSIFDAIGKALSRLSEALGLAGALAIMAVVAALSAVFIARRVRRAAGQHAEVPPDALPLGDDPAAESRLAAAAAARGDFREAVRRAFRAALLEVARRSPARLDPAWTTRELLDRVAVAPDVVVALAAAASCFDRAWYAGEPVTRADWETARARCEAVRAALRSGAEAPA